MQASTEQTSFPLTQEGQSSAIQKLQRLSKKLKAYFKERDDLIDVMMLAPICEQHVVVFGPPGEAKSAAIEALCNHILNIVYYEYQLFKSTTPDEVLGHYSLSEFKQDKLVRVTADKLPEAEIAYLDELFNASSALLNSCNGILNEHKFQRKRVPLWACYAATNFEPEDKELVAFHDRFAFRIYVDRIQSKDNFAAMLQLPTMTIDDSCAITKNEMVELQRRVKTIEWKPILDKIVLIWDLLRREAIDVSDRRYRWCIRALQASALINGRDHVNDSDLLVLQHMLWTEKTQIPRVRDILLKVVEPVMSQVNKSFNIAIGIERELRNTDPSEPQYGARVNEGVFKLGNIVDEIRAIRNTPGLSEKAATFIDEMVARIKDIKGFYQRCLKASL